MLARRAVLAKVIVGLVGFCCLIYYTGTSVSANSPESPVVGSGCESVRHYRPPIDPESQALGKALWVGVWVERTFDQAVVVGGHRIRPSLLI